MRNWLSAKTPYIVGILAVLLLFGSATFAQLYGAKASTEYRAEHPEKIKIFSAGSGANGPAELEEKVAAWLKENEDKITVTGRTQSGDRFLIVITVWYR